MIRKLLTLLSVISLLLGILAAALWVAGRSVEHRFSWTGRHGNATVSGSRGLILFWLATRQGAAGEPTGAGSELEHDTRDPPTNVYEEVSLWLRPGWQWGPLWLKDTGPGGFIRYRYAIVPAWAVVAGFWLPPAARAAWWVAGRRRACRRRGLCAACGYDLRGNVSGVCPECGKALPASVLS